MESSGFSHDLAKELLVAEMTPGFSGADLVSLAKNAAVEALLDDSNSELNLKVRNKMLLLTKTEFISSIRICLFNEPVGMFYSNRRGAHGGRMLYVQPTSIIMLVRVLANCRMYIIMLASLC